MTTRFPLWVVALVLFAAPPLAHAVSKEAQELMALREKHASTYCELTKLFKQLGDARKAKDEAKVQSVTERMRALEKKLSVDSARMEELRKSVRQTPDYRLLLEQQIKFDEACSGQPAGPGKSKAP